jgi:hypothetical protein
MKPVLLLAACLLLASPAAARESIIFGPIIEDEAPSMFVKLEAYGLGLSYPFGFTGQGVRVTFSAWGVRVGTSLVEGYSWLIQNGGEAAWPVHLGYTLVSGPRKALFFYNMVPESYVEVSTAFWKTGLVPFVRGSLYYGVEGYGFGAGIEAGVMSIGWDSGDWHVHRPFERRTAPYVALRLKLLAVSFGF